MKKKSLFYLLFFVSFLFTSCSDEVSDLAVQDSVGQSETRATTVDNKIKVTAVATYGSDEETVKVKGAVKNSIDGDYKTFWHSKMSKRYTANDLYYKIDGNNKKLSYIMYYPRQDGNKDGNFGTIIVEVAFADSPDKYKRVAVYQHNYSDKPGKIVLPEPIADVDFVHIQVLTGYNGYAACSEMEFYESNVEDDNSMKPATVTMPIIPANTFSDSGSGALIEKSGVKLVKNVSLPFYFTSYVRANTSGALSLYLNYHSHRTEGVLKVTVQGQSFNVVLPKGDGSLVSLPVGVIEVTEPGYLKIDMEVERSADNTTIPYGYLESFGFGGLTDLTFGKNPSDAGGTSVHLWYNMPTSENIEWFYNEITVPSGYDPTSTYYATNGSANSYAGIQVNSPTQRRIIFSVWSGYDTNNPNEIPEDYKVKFISSGPGVKRNQFGNEGSGSQSLLVYSWKSDVTYKILTGVKPLANGSTQYVCYYYAPEIGQWRLMAKMERPKTNIWNTGIYSFIEDFTGKSGVKSRMGYFGNQWVRTSSGKWVEVTKVTFNAPFNNRTDVAVGTNNYGIYLKSGGYFNENTPSGTVITRPAKGVAPSIDFSALPQ